jgi:murein L,D-transpeptidase YcbB/YkuD
MYFFYADKVYEGIDPKVSRQMGWYLPREKKSLVDYLDELMDDTDKLKKDEEAMYSMYYRLRTALKRFREIRDAGGWGVITLPEGTKSLKPGDNSAAVAQLRKRLFITGDLKRDNKSTVYDTELVDAVKRWQLEHHNNPDGLVGPQVIKDLNIPVEQRIKTILVNMERCRWITPEIDELKEYVYVNIPSYSMRYLRDGRLALESNVVVGKELNKTVIFSGKMSYLVFAPYWNVPKSIIAEEIQPGIDQNPNYLEEHDMEWNDGNVRQRPGPNNSLGLVKFMFPNANNIYLHDTPAKSLFKRDDRALSHGCVRVEKARELAIKILDGDRNWDAQKIDEAMNSGEEKNYSLKRKIPVYIVYFTALVDEHGHISFYDDVYKRDEKLARVLYTDD